CVREDYDFYWYFDVW
nr:immunoglobulin heavy chain junction region [Mus musculus]